jgi:hypothetical protein
MLFGVEMQNVPLTGLKYPRMQMQDEVVEDFSSKAPQLTVGEEIHPTPEEEGEYPFWQMQPELSAFG